MLTVNGSTEVPRVLVVEDEMVLRMRAADIVEDAGFTPVEAVNADEAIAIGLATRKVALGTTRAEAERLAREIAGFPPIAMTSDRQSAYESFDRDQTGAVQREMELSLAARRQESQKGAARFAQGKGRHGKFEGQ